MIDGVQRQRADEMKDFLDVKNNEETEKEKNKERAQIQQCSIRLMLHRATVNNRQKTRSHLKENWI